MKQSTNPISLDIDILYLRVKTPFGWVVNSSDTDIDLPLEDRIEKLIKLAKETIHTGRWRIMRRMEYIILEGKEDEIKEE